MRLVVVAVMMAGCARGGVELRLDAPDDAALDPLAGAATLTLTATAAGAIVHTATIPAPARGDALDFGEVPVGDDLRFEVAGVAASGRVVAYGRAGPIDLRADDEVELTIHLRRPFVYLASDEGLLAVDATREPGEVAAEAIDVGGPASAVAVTADGREVVVVTDTAVRLVPTDAHVAVDAAAPLGGPASDLAVTADGRRAVVTRASDGEIAIVDLDALRAGAPVAPVTVAATRPDAIAIAGDVAWILDEPLDNLFCAGASTIRAIPLDDPAAAPPPIEVGGPATELAITPEGDAALVTLPCANEVRRLDAAGASEVVLEIPGPSSVSVDGDRLWVAGHVDGEQAHLILASLPVGGGDPDLLTLPPTVERAVATQLAGTGQDGVLEITSDLSSAFDLTVLPDREHVAIRFVAGYLTEPAGNAGGGQPVIPALTMITHEYQLVQRDTGLAAQRVRLRCDLSWEDGALLDDFECARAPGQDVRDPPAIPADVAALYGSR